MTAEQTDSATVQNTQPVSVETTVFATQTPIANTKVATEAARHEIISAQIVQTNSIDTHTVEFGSVLSHVTATKSTVEVMQDDAADIRQSVEPPVIVEVLKANADDVSQEMYDHVEIAGIKANEEGIDTGFAETLNALVALDHDEYENDTDRDTNEKSVVLSTDTETVDNIFEDETIEDETETVPSGPVLGRLVVVSFENLTSVHPDEKDITIEAVVSEQLSANIAEHLETLPVRHVAEADAIVAHVQALQERINAVGQTVVSPVETQELEDQIEAAIDRLVDILQLDYEPGHRQELIRVIRLLLQTDNYVSHTQQHIEEGTHEKKDFGSLLNLLRDAMQNMQAKLQYCTALGKSALQTYRSTAAA